MCFSQHVSGKCSGKRLSWSTIRPRVAHPTNDVKYYGGKLAHQLEEHLWSCNHLSTVWGNDFESYFFLQVESGCHAFQDLRFFSMSLPRCLIFARVRGNNNRYGTINTASIFHALTNIAMQVDLKDVGHGINPVVIWYFSVQVDDVKFGGLRRGVCQGGTVTQLGYPNNLSPMTGKICNSKCVGIGGF